MKYILICLVATTLILIGCAKSTEPHKVEPLNIERIYPTIGIPHDIIITENALFLAEDQAGFSIYDREAGELAARVSYLEEYGVTTHLGNIRQLGYAEHYDRLYVYDRYGGPAKILHYDVSNIYEPEWTEFNNIGQTDGVHRFWTNTDEDGILEIAISYSRGSFLYMTTDVPSFLLDAGQIYAMPNAVRNFDIVDQYAYIAGVQRGLYIFDLQSRTLLSELNLTGEALDVRVKGNYAYIVAKQEGLLVADISDKTNPQWIHSIDTSGWAQSIDLEGDHLAVGSGGGGVYLFDIGQNPAEPRLIDRVPSSVVDYVLIVKIRDSRLFVAGRYQGISEIKIR